MNRLMIRLIWLLALLSGAGCSTGAIVATDGATTWPVRQANARYVREAIAVGAASVIFGSLALGNVDQNFKVSREGWFEKDSKYAGIDKLGHAWYGNAIADGFFERNPNRFTRVKSSAALGSAVSFGIMALVEIADGFAGTDIGFSFEDVVANAAGAGFSYLRNTRPRLKRLVDYRIEYLPRYSARDLAIDTFYSDLKYLLAWKLSGVDALQKSGWRFFEIHTGYFTRGYSSEETGQPRQRNGFVGVGVNLAEVFGLQRPESARSRRLLKGFFDHVQLPKTRLEAPAM